MVSYQLDHGFFDINQEGAIFLKRSVLEDGSTNLRVFQLSLSF